MLGLTLEGGASRTIFSCGVMDVLLENEIIADMVVGVSAGISFALSYVSGQKGRNLELARKYMPDKRYCGIRHLINPKNRSIYNLDFVFYEIPEKLLPFDYDAFEKFKGRVIGVLTNLETGLPEYIDIPRDDHYMTYLRAGCALPVLFPVFNIKGKKYMDGGIADSIPFKKAINDGCDKNIVILTRESGYKKGTDKATEFASKKFKKYENFSKALKNRAKMYNSQIEELEKLEKEGKIFVFRPETTKGISRTESDPKVLENLYYQGADIARKRMSELLSYLES